MRQLRLVTTWVAALSAVFALGCDTGPGTEVDAGAVGVDAGPRDSGPTTIDSGPPTGVDGGVDGGDGGMMCTGPATGDCSLVDPTSCGAGMACVMNGGSVAGWTTVCITAGVGGQGAACDPTMQGQCQEGFTCSSGCNICQKICCTTADCDAGDFCGNIAGLNAGTCTTSIDCDLIAQTGCDGCADTGCYPAAGGLNCVSPGTLTEGAECASSNACLPGMGCIGPAAGPSNCRTWCDMAAADPCPTDFACTGVGGLPVGTCTPTP